MSSTSSFPSLRSCLQLPLTSRDHPPPKGLFKSAMLEIMSGDVPDVLISAWIGCLPLASLHPSILSECVEGLRATAIAVHPSDPEVPSMDIVGTGGDGLNVFNVSTASAFVVAACGQRLVKHGNRSSSSSCGSADLVEALGAPLHMDTPTIANMLREINFAFLFAQSFHPSMKNVATLRKAIGVRTIFNLLGPLSNPITPGVQYQLTGVWAPHLGELFARTLLNIGVRRAAVVHSHDGMDEISPSVPTHIWMVDSKAEESKRITEFDVAPQDFGLPTYRTAEVASGNAAENAQTLRDIANGVQCPQRDFVLMNSAMALFICEKAKDLKEGVQLAKEAIASGKVANTIKMFIELSNKSVKQPSPPPSSSPSPSLTILEKIAHRRSELIDEMKNSIPLPSLLSSLLHQPSSYPFASSRPLSIYDQILSHPLNGVALAAEIKRASPSAGDINLTLDPVAHARSYWEGGASIISVLTEPQWFKGSYDDLIRIRSNFSSASNRPAILMKDFIVDEYQIYHARMIGADSILLIVALFVSSPHRLTSLISLSRQLQMEPLVEVANESELPLALAAGATVVGINNRNLHTFTVDPNTTNTVAAKLSQSSSSTVLLCALSGIKVNEDVERYRQSGAKMVLVGETLMKAKDVKATIRNLMGISNDGGAPIVLPRATQTPYVKICGIRDEDSALVCSASGADFIGLIFAPKSKRRIGVSTARRIVSRLHPGFIHQLGPQTTSTVDKLRRSTRGRPLVVGVFQNQHVEEINRICAEVKLDMVQLHGEEGFDVSPQIVKPVIRAVSVVPKVTTSDSIISLLEEEQRKGWRIAAVLLDTKGGGTGEPFDWSIAAEVGKKFPIILAGGLNPQNVEAAVRMCNPWGIDVASGVEADEVSGKPSEKTSETKESNSKETKLPTSEKSLADSVDLVPEEEAVPDAPKKDYAKIKEFIFRAKKI